MVNTHDLVAFHQRKLIITDTAIRDELGHDVMMDWEHPIMKRHAELVTWRGADVLEIGFGMAISATYIQALEPKSHTIVECHPQIIERLHLWAKDKPSVRVVEGAWWDRRHDLATYDGILYDTYDDPNCPDFFENYERLLKPQGRMTFYNQRPEPQNLHGLEGVEYHAVAVKPDKNDYHNESTYYVPVVTRR